MNPLRGPPVGAAPGFEDLVQEGLASVLVRWARISATDDPVASTNRVRVNAAASWRRRPSRRESAAVLDDDRPVPGADAATDAHLALVALRASGTLAAYGVADEPGSAATPAATQEGPRSVYQAWTPSSTSTSTHRGSVPATSSARPQR